MEEETEEERVEEEDGGKRWRKWAMEDEREEDEAMTDYEAMKYWNADEGFNASYRRVSKTDQKRQIEVLEKINQIAEQRKAKDKTDGKVFQIYRKPLALQPPLFVPLFYPLPFQQSKDGECR